MFVAAVQFIVIILILLWLLKQKAGGRYSGKSVFRFLVAGALSVLLCFGLTELLHISPQTFFGMNPVLSGFLTALFTAALTEECVKYALFRLAIVRNKEVATWHDAIIACIVVGMGFTLLEDITYVMGGDGSIVRAILPMHLLFQAFMGYFYGKARVEKSLKYNVLSLIVPILLHTLFDMFIIGMISIVGGDISAIRNISEEELAKLPYFGYIIPMAACVAVVSIAGLIALIVFLHKISKWSRNGEKQDSILSDN